MRINNKSQLGINFTDEMRKFIWKNQSAIIEKYDDADGFFKKNEASLMVKDILSDDKNKNYLFTQSAIAVCDKIKITKFEPEQLSLEGKKYNKATLLINDKLFYRFIITEKEVFCMIGEIQRVGISDMFFYTTFRLIPSINTITIPESISVENEKIQKCLRYLIFFEFAEIEEQILVPNQSAGTKREGKIKNDTNTNLTIVDTTWNKFIRVVGKFSVSGHFRLQPCGEGLKHRKLIFIEEFTKNGYSRKTGKEIAI